MTLLECSGPFQWKPSYVKFGDFKRFMWGYFAVTVCPYGINELFVRLGRAGATIYNT